MVRMADRRKRKVEMQQAEQFLTIPEQGKEKTFVQFPFERYSKQNKAAAMERVTKQMLEKDFIAIMDTDDRLKIWGHAYTAALKLADQGDAIFFVWKYSHLLDFKYEKEKEELLESLTEMEAIRVMDIAATQRTVYHQSNRAFEALMGQDMIGVTEQDGKANDIVSSPANKAAEANIRRRIFNEPVVRTLVYKRKLKDENGKYVVKRAPNNPNHTIYVKRHADEFDLSYGVLDRICKDHKLGLYRAEIKKKK